MNRKIFTYLKRSKLTDIRMVNRLFVSAFMRHHNLVSRVNTLLMDAYIQEDTDDYAQLCELIDKLNESDCEYTLEDLTKLFEFVISPEDRKISGAIYTPEYIRQRIVDEVFAEYDREISAAHVADIACGCGGFLLTVAEYIHSCTGNSYFQIIRENLFGIDLQHYSIERTKLLLALLALMNGEDVDLPYNLWIGNTLCFNFSLMGKVDVVVGNPPYVCARNMSAETLEQVKKWRVCQSGNSDLYIPFFQIAIELVRDGGRIGYITMNSFLTSLNGRSLREYFHEYSYRIQIVDFRGEQIFRGCNTYTCLFFLQKAESNNVAYCINENKILKPQFIYTDYLYAELDAISGWKLNDFIASKNHETIGTQLGKFCQSRHGIATLSNKTYVFKPVKETDNTLIFLRENEEIEIERDICRKIVNSNKLNSNVIFDSIVEYVIFPYHLSLNGSMELIPENIMQIEFPLAYRYLCSQKEILLKRDKGHTDKYPAWYAYGRTQSLRMPRYKLFFPKIANKELHCELVDDADLLLYNGMAFVSDEESKLVILKKVMESEVFWQYVYTNSKPYSSGYYSLNGVNIKLFGIPDFIPEELTELLLMEEKKEINKWLRQFYE